MTTMAVALDRNLFSAYYSVDAIFIPIEERVIKVSVQDIVLRRLAAA